ncbi:uncharacterized protein LOC123546290 [Mercenaria mercenaria]|uniref:uncharacterized protein LOC123546290 n=1 Tax=Mercenaria mercenaria TaxID=6596 RepID=UPI00234E9D11|nr:uncharacterized protein LOC123546290 [Mercenaria mercenaria]
MDNSPEVESKRSKKKKVDPSFKSKRYRDKLRAEVKALENLIPVDRPTLNKKLDSQTIYRLAIAFLRVKTYLKGRLYPNSRNLSLGQTTNHRNTFDANHTAETFIPLQDCDGKHGTQNEQNMSADNQTHQRSRATKPGDILEGSGSKIESVLDPATLYQMIEGFVVLASADGTIMFVTENISKYTGFSQVDLIHRCLYSIIHPEDFQDLKDALESHHARRTNEGIMQKGTDEYSSNNFDNFFCRIRCYHGNTTGYIKLHCSGKIHHLTDMTKTTQTSKSVVLLYCQPFLKTGNDVIDDEKKDVFWSKHDLDLKFKEIEETPILGYSSSDVSGTSLYQYVHPEDLCILDNVHRAVTKVTEVQSFFFRLEMKQGGWIWLYCKGKVICKNSKKFSIVFSHCPVRDDENVFIKQESLLRRHRLANFLQQSSDISASNSHPPQHADQLNEAPHLSNQPCHIQYQYHNHLGFDSDQHGDNALANGYIIDGHGLSSSFAVHNMSCPSSWHADSERHSPVLPNNHAAQKTLQRERQLHIAEYRRKQYFEQKRALMTSLHPNNNCVSIARAFPEQLQSVHSIPMASNTFTHQDNFSSHADSPCNWSFPYNECRGDYGRGYISPQLHELNYPCRQDFNPENVYVMPPHISHNDYFSLQNQKVGYFESVNGVPENTKHPTDIYGYGVPRDKQCLVPHFSPNVQNFYSSANVRFSMVCNSDFNIYNPVSKDNVNCSAEMHETFKSNTGIPRNIIKSERGKATCCAMSEGIEPAVKPGVKYDIEASIYMRIVEAQNTRHSQTTNDFPPCKSLVSL